MARRLRHLILLLVTGLMGAALVAPPAGAAPTWRPVTNLFADLSAAGGSAFAPAIAVDAAGNATVLWSRWNGTQFVVQASYRPVGGTWSAPVDLAGGRQVIDPQVVVDRAGNATAIWRRVETDRSVVQSASRPLGGHVERTGGRRRVDPSVDYTRRDVPQVAVDAAGVVTATWSRFEAAPGQPWKDTVQSATRATDGTWSTPVDLSPAGTSARTTDVAVDAAGNATAVWRSAVDRPGRHPSCRRHVVGPDPAHDHRQRPRATRGSSSTRPAPPPPCGTASPAASTASRPRPVRSAARGPARSTSRAARSSTRPAIAVDRQGTATALWQQYDGSGWIVTSATRTAGGAWSTPVSLSTPARDSWDPQVAVDLAGNATALWSRADDDGRVVEAARRPAGGEWSAPIDLSAPGDAWHPQVAVDPAGNATAAWSRKDGTS